MLNTPSSVPLFISLKVIFNTSGVCYRLDKERKQVQKDQHKDLEEMSEMTEEFLLLEDECDECLTQRNEAYLEQEVRS
jgi:hypothetical protein